MREITITPDVRAEIKLGLNIFLKDVGEIGITVGIAFLLSNLFPAEQSLQQTIFLIMVLCWRFTWICGHVLTQVSETLN